MKKKRENVDRSGSIVVEISEPKPSKAAKEKARDAFQRIRRYRKAAGLIWKADQKPGQKLRGLRMEARDALTTHSRLIYRRVDHIHTAILRHINPEEKIKLHEDVQAISNPFSQAGLSSRRDSLDYIKEYVKNWRAALHYIQSYAPSAANLVYLENIIQLRREGWFLGEQERLVFSKNKSPKEAEAHIGIEVECFVPSETLLRIALKPFCGCLSIVGDGSINPIANYTGREVRILVKKAELASSLPPILEAMRGVGAKVNESCGLHVHFDMRGITDELLHLRYERLFLAQFWLAQLVEPHRRTNDYCKPNRERRFDVERSRGDRYSRINTQAFNKYHTLEIRLHHGSVNTSDIINWIEVISSIMANAPVAVEAPVTPEGFAAWAGLNETLTAYVVEKCEQHKAHNKPMCLMCMSHGDNCTCCDGCGHTEHGCLCCSVCEGGNRDRCGCCHDCERTADNCNCESACSECDEMESSCTCENEADEPTLTNTIVLDALGVRRRSV